MGLTTMARDPLALERAFKGRLFRPADDGYDQARRVHYAHLDRRPALIAQPTDASDVAAAVGHAASSGLQVVVRAGGHDPAGHSAGHGAVVLDFSALDGIEIDVAGRTAWAGAGVLAGDYTRAVQAHGLVTPFGETGSVGVAGITLGGGMGWLVRKHGLTIDNLLAIEIVTADGRLLTATEREHADLFWALRGGGGGLGVVTRLQFRLHPLGEVVAGDIVFEASPDLLRALVPVLSAAPAELTAMPLVTLAPPDPRIPEPLQGRPIVYLSVVWSGAPDAADEALEPLRRLADPVYDDVARKAYGDLFPTEDPEAVDEPDPAWGVAWRTVFIDSLDEALAAAIERRLTEPEAPELYVQLRVLGGAVEHVPSGATAFGWRHRPALLWIVAPYLDLERAAEIEAWTEATRAEFSTASAGSGDPGPAYLNFIGTVDPEAIRASFPGPTLARLREVKRRYDPGELFRGNRAIDPA